MPQEPIEPIIPAVRRVLSKVRVTLQKRASDEQRVADFVVSHPEYRSPVDVILIEHDFEIDDLFIVKHEILRSERTYSIALDDENPLSRGGRRE